MALDSDEDDYVAIGTSLPEYEEDEIPKKPVAAHDQTVTDSKGRQRFHGAFTGGFSAGYFNSVGSKEGWTPSTFVSSREKKDGARHHRMPEHFMDEEDFGEHGIAPKVVNATSEFASRQTKERKRKNLLPSSGVLPETDFLHDIVAPVKSSVGVVLLRSLGWKEGQGIGPRGRRQRKTPKSRDGGKTYGCSLPPTFGGSEGSADEDEEFVEHIEFAPKDVVPVTFTPKDNVHGLGYSGINPRTALGHVELFSSTPVLSTTGKRGMKGHAFGVGAMEDDDDDIYATQGLSGYDRVLEAPPEQDTHGWTAPGTSGRHPGAGNLGQKVLPGFTPASQPLAPKRVYPPPSVPRHYQPCHRFPDVSVPDVPVNQQDRSRGWVQRLTASQRAAMLEETPDIKSVFDLVGEKDRAKLTQNANQRPAVREGESAMTSFLRMQAAARGQSEPTPASAPPPAGDSSGSDKSRVLLALAGHTAGLTIPKVEATSSSGVSPEVKTPGATPTIAKASLGFKPFAKDPKKQGRYERFQALQKEGKTYEPKADDTSGLTEWERDHEVEEFSRASALFRPLSAMIASRFTKAEYQDDEAMKAAKLQEAEQLGDGAAAASLNMFGRLTRDVMTWCPDKVLCKRFNVPNPYPDSTTVGVPRAKREKFTLYNLLTYAPSEAPDVGRGEAPDVGHQEELQQTLQTTAQKKKNILGKGQGKPLAILANGISLAAKPRAGATSQDAAGEPSAGGTGGVVAGSAATPPEGEARGEVSPAEVATGADKPPMDLFKAIFEDSDSESEASSEDPEVTTKNEPKHIAAPEGGVKPGSGISSDPGDNNGAHRDSFSRDVTKGSVGDDQSKGADPVTSQGLPPALGPPSPEAMVFGPPLPPVLVISSSSDSDSPAATKHRHHHKKEKKGKKGKYKKQKTKDKKKKKKKKKKSSKDKKRPVVVVSSGSDADSESS